MTESVVLHQFLYSHYNEKARWALDWKRIPHVRETYLPGPHLPQIKRLSGQAQTPVLVLDGRVIAGSARIVDELERRHPERPLYPPDPGLEERALAFQSEFDAEVGPAVRTALFSVMIDEPDYLCRIFSHTKSAPVRFLYRATYPLAKGLIRKGNGADDPHNVARAFERTQQALDAVATAVRPSGQLVGEEFTVADLSVAALLAPLVHPRHPDMARPGPVPPRLEEFFARWASHPGAQWVLEQYARHRPPPAATA